MVSAYEQRGAKRTDVTWPVSVWHPQASRFFNGQSMNVSRTGVMLTLPLKTPLQPGQDVELNFPRTKSLAQDKGSFARIKNAKVVRIDRSDSLSSATVKVGLSFYEKLQAAQKEELSLA